MNKKYFPTIKKAVLPADVTTELESLAAEEILEHGIGTDFKYYVLRRIEPTIEDSKVEIIQYDLKGVPEENIDKFITGLEEIVEG